MLAIHGSGGGYDQGIRVIAMSRFGYLRTPMHTDASAAAQADAHACLLDVLGIRQAAVMGGSAGAPSVLQMAAVVCAASPRYVANVAGSNRSYSFLTTE